MKYALVTGGSRGIGRAICLKLSQAGYSIIVNYCSNQEAANETKAQIISGGGEASLLKFDVSDKEQVDIALKEWREGHPKEYIEVVINNAGIREDALLLWMEAESWHKVIGVSLHGMFNVTQPLIKDMLVKRLGRVINIVSLSGLKGLPGQTNYSAAKGGVIAATKALAQEVAKKGVTVNAVAPGFILSDMTEGLDVDVLKKQIPMERFGKPEEVAELVCFLASSGASYITGEVISINGGLYT